MEGGKLTPKEKMELIIRRTKENDATASRARLNQAFQKADELHQGAKRKDGETPYIDHPVSVAKIVADNGGDQIMVIAALLHDTVEDTAYTLQSLSVTFGQDVADIVDALTKVEANIPDQITNSHQRRLIKDYVDGLSNSKLLDPTNPQAGKAVYIKLADRLHNMQTLDSCTKESQRRKATDTLQFFVPLARLIGSKYFERELSELCFKTLQPELFREIDSAYEETRLKNARHIESFMKTFDLALRNVPADNSPSFRKVSSGSFKCYQIRNLLGTNVLPYSSMGSFSKSAIYLYEIVLEYHGDALDNMLPNFMEIYNAEIKRAGINLRIEFNHPDKSIIAIDLRDGLSNRYLVLLRPYKPLFSTSDYSSLFPPNTSLVEMPEKFITVFSKDGDPYQLEEGATVLDFAFRIHPDLGCSALYALIRRGSLPFIIKDDPAFSEVIVNDENDVECEIDHVLQDGDCVLVVSDQDSTGAPIYHAQFDWFRCVRTKYACDHLIEFFDNMAALKSRSSGPMVWKPTASRLYSSGLIDEIN